MKLTPLLLLILMLMTANNFAYSSTGLLQESTEKVPTENIRQANAIYFHHVSLIDKLMTLDSLRTAHNQSLNDEIRILNASSNVNQQIIDNQKLQLTKHEKLITSYKIQNRLLWTGIITVTTFFLLQ